MVRALTEHEMLCRECENRPVADLSGMDCDGAWQKFTESLDGEPVTFTVILSPEEA